MVKLLKGSSAMNVLLLSTFLMNVGQFTILPFLTLYLINVLHYSAWQVGTLLSANFFCTYALPMISEMVRKRTRYSTTIVAGVGIRGLGFIGLSLFQVFSLLLFSSILIGIGGAFYNASVNAVFASQPQEQRKHILTLFHQAFNLGYVVGSLISGLLIIKTSTPPFLFGGGIFICMTVLLFHFRHHYYTMPSQSLIIDSLKLVIGHEQFVSFSIIMVLFWMLFSQLTVSFSLEAFQRSHEGIYASLVIMVNGIAGILFMSFVLKRVFHRYNSILLVQISMCYIAVVFILVPLFSSITWLLICVFLYTLGETLVIASCDLTMARLRSKEDFSTFFSTSSFSLAIGGTIGSYLGTWLMTHNGPISPWTVYGIIGVVAFLLLQGL